MGIVRTEAEYKGGDDLSPSFLIEYELKRTMTHASVFSGIGGPEVAAAMLGWQNLFHCEINPFGRQVLDYWFPNAESYEDITTTDFSKWRGRVDVLTGGFPCQPFSYAGRRRGAEDDRYLWPSMYRAIDEIQPTWVVAENVAGILTMVEQGEVSKVAGTATLFDAFDDLRGRYELRETFTLQRICTDLESHGYAVQPVLVPACAVGAPHRRDRVFIVARRLKDTDLSGRPIRRSGEGCEEHGDGRTAEHASSGRDEMPNDTPRTAENERRCLASDGGCTSADTDNERQPRRCSKDSRGRTDTSAIEQGELQRESERCGSSGTTPHPDSHRGCEVDEHMESELADGAKPVSNGGQRNVADTRHAGLQEARPEQPTAGHRGFGVRTGEWVERFGRGEEIGSRWQDFPSVSPVHRGNDGLPFDVDDLSISEGKWRTEALKAYGNAIVPQVMYEIFRAIEQVETHKNG